MLIETERLRLRALAICDVDDLVALHAHPVVNRFVPSLGRDEAVKRVRADQRQWADRGYGLFAVLARDGGRFLGRVGLKYWSLFDETEVGWVLRPDAWGRGYATESARACVDWAFTDLDLASVTAMIRPDNAGSIRVAQRLGMTPLRSDVLLDIPVIVYAVDRGTWLARDPSGTRVA